MLAKNTKKTLPNEDHSKLTTNDTDKSVVTGCALSPIKCSMKSSFEFGTFGEDQQQSKTRDSKGQFFGDFGEKFLAGANKMVCYDWKPNLRDSK